MRSLVLASLAALGLAAAPAIESLSGTWNGKATCWWRSRPATPS